MATEWKVVEEWAQARLITARQILEGDHDGVVTAKQRGRIAVLKELIALPETLQRDKESQSLNGGPDF